MICKLFAFYENSNHFEKFYHDFITIGGHFNVTFPLMLKWEGGFFVA